MTKEAIAKEIENGLAALGIEFGSTRIKAVLIDSEKNPVAQGGFTWENSLADGIWTYSLEEVQEAFLMHPLKLRFHQTLQPLPCRSRQYLHQ